MDSMMRGIYRNWDSDCFYQYLEKFHINRKKKIKEYSRGMKIKLSLSIALSHNAGLLILDEPTSGLDPVVREEVLDILKEFVMDESHSVLISRRHRPKEKVYRYPASAVSETGEDRSNMTLGAGRPVAFSCFLYRWG